MTMAKNQLEIVFHNELYWYRRQSDPSKMKQLDKVYSLHLVNALKKAVRELAIVPYPQSYKRWEDAVNTLDNGIQLTDRFDHLEETGALQPEHRFDIQAAWTASQAKFNTEVTNAEFGGIT